MRRVRSLTGPDVKTRDLVINRDGGRCVVCARTATDVHHRTPRGMAGSSDPAINSAANLICLCSDCHRGIESRRTEAERHGYIVRRPLNPAVMPVLIKGSGWVLLRADGSREWVRHASH